MTVSPQVPLCLSDLVLNVVCPWRTIKAEIVSNSSFHGRCPYAFDFVGMVLGNGR